MPTIPLEVNGSTLIIVQEKKIYDAHHVETVNVSTLKLPDM